MKFTLGDILSLISFLYFRYCKYREQQVVFTVNTELASANPLPRQFQMPPPYEPGQNTLQNDQVIFSFYCLKSNQNRSFN